MKKISLLAMLCVFSIMGIQSAQAVENSDFDVKRPHFERNFEHHKFENKGLTDKEIEKRKKEMKKDHEKWEKEKKKNWEKRQKQKEKNRKEWEKKHKKYGDANKPNWDKNRGHNPHYAQPKHHKYDKNSKYSYAKKHPHSNGQMMNKGERHHNHPHFKQYPQEHKNMHRKIIDN